MRKAVAALPLALLCACGLKAPLEPAQGRALPPAPAMASSRPTADRLLVQPATARPERTDELLSRSEERESDHFDLPPAEVPPGQVPVRVDEDGNQSEDQPQP